MGGMSHPPVLHAVAHRPVGPVPLHRHRALPALLLAAGHPPVPRAHLVVVLHRAASHHPAVPRALALHPRAAFHHRAAIDPAAVHRSALPLRPIPLSYGHQEKRTRTHLQIAAAIRIPGAMS